MASGSIDRHAEDALSKLLQMGTVVGYQSEFEILINRVTGISKNLLKSFYISGLKLALQCALLRSNLTTLGEAFSLARATEARFTDLQLWELLMSNPTTLREAFSLCRITEARFEDQQTSSFSNKTSRNLLTSNQLAAGLEANKVVNDGEEELETKVLVDGKQDDIKLVKVVVWPMSKTLTSQMCCKSRRLGPFCNVEAMPRLEVPSASALQVLRRLGSIFTSVYAAVHKLKKKLKRVVSFLEGLQGGKKIALCQKNKAISLGK
ncbi:hypothetical protein Tco_0691731 [Tanacetum coccineum]